MLFLFALVSLVLPFAYAVQLNHIDYEGAVNALVNSLADDVSGNEGIVSHTGIYESLYQEDLSQFNFTINYLSGDNYGKVDSLLKLASQANDKDLVGDLVYLAHYASVGGYNEYMQLNDKSSFAKDLLSFCNNDATIFTKLSKSSSNQKLQDFFQKLISQESDTSSSNNLEKRYDGTYTCDDKHTAVKGSCVLLKNYLWGNPGTIPHGPRAVCYAGCCVSWSMDAPVVLGDLAPRVDTCIQTCPNDQFSCINHDVVIGNVYGEDVCVSGRTKFCH
ncbi:Schizosaccharomyces japonicus specific family with GPPY motif and periodic tyrosine [Schizosaccharomyces osmophilus]|uniref:Schizosaccharomyces japonicus specific family with GPPY motif and periodic tyrosine n=1 Tax=Schizosaccharomyces osmophilus TaxID=2545709 RepID=A0AAF0AVQ3_9SCHI|nr:Schizosaccharomyces japonicus specific family with GPPY motif and periodic tyrosine [Schizosaccharomyces osmophilus]WBW73816.1 Schizosaccharomyces japonicus specific family with GPPY motif and periodic tyrosine [Schizosaccharomyces osmophilus]